MTANGIIKNDADDVDVKATTTDRYSTSTVSTTTTDLMDDDEVVHPEDDHDDDDDDHHDGSHVERELEIAYQRQNALEEQLKSNQRHIQQLLQLRGRQRQRCITTTTNNKCVNRSSSSRKGISRNEQQLQHHEDYTKTMTTTTSNSTSEGRSSSSSSSHSTSTTVPSSISSSSSSVTTSSSRNVVVSKAEEEIEGGDDTVVSDESTTTSHLPSSPSPSAGASKTTGNDIDNGNNDIDDKGNGIDIEEVLREYLYMEATRIENASLMVSQYSSKLNELGIPVDRFFIGGIVPHHKAMAYDYKWEKNETDNDNNGNDYDKVVGVTGTIQERRIPRHVMDNLHNIKQPIALMFCNKVPRGSSIRFGYGEGYKYDSTWFDTQHYTDYLCLPMIKNNNQSTTTTTITTAEREQEQQQRHLFMGGVAVATKSPGGFTKEQVQILHNVQNDFTTVFAHHVHEVGYKLLVNELEDEVMSRTRDLELANSNLEQANKHITRQSQSRLEHFAMMSHEIRTPLNGIVGMASLLLHNSKTILHNDQELIDSIQLIVDSGDLLASVVNDVLDYSKLESTTSSLTTSSSSEGQARSNIELSRVNIHDLLSTVVDTIQIKGNEKHVTVHTSNYRQTVPKLVYTDGRRLQQILYNLMGNALKFSNSDSTIDLSIQTSSSPRSSQSPSQSSSSKTGDSTATTKNAAEVTDCDLSSSTTEQLQREILLTISVKDYGRGIRPEDLTKIFEPFTQGSNDTERLYGGTGLGLAITNKLVKSLGGTIVATSEFGKWSEFVVEISVNVDDGEDNVTGSSGATVASKSSPPVPPTVSSEPTQQDQTLPVREPTASEQSTLSTATTSPKASDLGNPKATSKVSMAPSNNAKGNDSNKSSPDASVDYAGLRVLIAEDNLVNQKVLARNLQSIGMKDITIVGNGQKAVNAASEVTYDVIFMDMQMPIMDGLEATRQIVAMKKDKAQQQSVVNGAIESTPPDNKLRPRIIFVTAHALNSYQEEADAAGCCGFISKPFNRKKICEMLETML